MIVMVFGTAAVFADDGHWNSDRTIYYLDPEETTPATGLFKAKMKDGVGALFFADDSGLVRKTPGLLTVDGSKKRFLRSKDSEGHWGFREVSDTNTNPYTYFVGTNGQGAIVEDSQFYTYSGKKYFVQTNGTVKTTAGFVTVDDNKYYVRKGGSVRTKAGWVHYNNKKYRVQSNGTVRTKEGAFTANGKRYVVKSDGSICTKRGPVKANGKLYFVKNSKGHLGGNYYYKVGNKTFHVNKNGLIKVGRHKWKNGKYYYSVEKGYLKLKKGIVNEDGDNFLVEKGGKVVVSQKIDYKGKSYIAKKNGTFRTGLFKWHKVLYYANSNGELKSTAGIVKVNGKRYYVAAGGVVCVNQRIWSNGNLYIADVDGHLLSGFFDWGGASHYAESNYCVYYNQRFTVNGKTYIADSYGNIRTGVFKFGGQYYHSDSSGVLNTRAGIVYYGGKYYYNNSGGGIATHQWINTNGKHYYAGNNGAFFTKEFYYRNVKIHPASDGSVSDEEYQEAINAVG